MIRSLVPQLRKEVLLVEVPVLVRVCVLNELQYVVIAYYYVQVLVENLLYFRHPHQPLLLPVEQREHVHRLLLLPLVVEPLLVDQIQHFSLHELVLVLVGGGDLVFDLLAVHFGEAEVAEDAPEVFSIDVSGFLRVVKVEGIPDFVFLNRGVRTISSESLLWTEGDFPFPMFFFPLFISYIIYQLYTIVHPIHRKS